jgi:hypothetical protein
MRPTFLHVNGTLYWTIYVYNPDTAILKDADSTPTVSVRKNGLSTGDSVTITKRSATTGIYDCSYNPASEVEGDIFWFEEEAIVTGTSTTQATYNNSWVANVVGQFSTLPSGVWSNVTRTLSDGANIVLAKGTGITGFNDLDALGIRSSIGLASDNIDSKFSDISDKLPSGLINGSIKSYVYEIQNDAINVAATNANLVSWIQEGIATSNEIDSVRVLVSGVKTKTDQLTFSTANKVDINASDLDAQFSNIPSGVVSYAMPESYAGSGQIMSISQAMYMIHQILSDFAISGATISVKKLDGSEAASFILDSPNRPTSKGRVS